MGFSGRSEWLDRRAQGERDESQFDFPGCIQGEEVGEGIWGAEEMRVKGELLQPEEFELLMTAESIHSTA